MLALWGVFRFVRVRPSEKEIVTNVEKWVHVCPMDTFLVFFLNSDICGILRIVGYLDNITLLTY